MTNVELGACEWFVWDLRRSNLLARVQLEQAVTEFLEHNPKAEPPALAEYMVQQGILSTFQAESLLAGKGQTLVLGPYMLVSSVGTGSMGSVYQAQSKNSPLPYAVKVLPRRSMWNIRLARRRVRDFEQFKHPGVIPFVDVGTAGGTHYLVWPFVKGETLDKRIERDGKLAPSEAAYYVREVADALAVCHSREVVHGLIKPSNITITEENQVAILDFGVGSLLAQTEGESVVDTMSTANTLASGLDCASPESIMDPNAITPASDQYSLGCVFYYLLTGNYPFTGNSAVEKMMAHQTKKAEPIQKFNPEVPDEIVEIIERMMQKQPNARYPNMTDVAAAIKPFVREFENSMPTTSRTPPIEKKQSRANLIPTTTANRISPPLPDRPEPDLPLSSAQFATPELTSDPMPTMPQAQRPQSGRLVMPTRAAVVAPPVHAPTPVAAPAPPPTLTPAPVPGRGRNQAPAKKSQEGKRKRYSAAQSLEERLGTIGLLVICLLLGAVVWIAYSMLVK